MIEKSKDLQYNISTDTQCVCTQANLGNTYFLIAALM